MKKILPNKIQIDILKRHLGPFVFCFVTLMFLLLMQFLILYISKLVGKGLPADVIIKLIVTNLAYMVVLAGPMAVLVATLMAFGKFSELNELTALRSAGVNPIHAMSPVLVAGFILSLFMFWFANNVLPDANQRARSLFMDIRTKKPGFNLEEGQFYNGISGYTFLVKNMGANSDTLHNITLFQQASSNKDAAVIRAHKGYLVSTNPSTLTLYLLNGSILRHFSRYNNGVKKKIVEKTRFERYRLSFDVSAMNFYHSNPNDHSRDNRTMDIQAMHAVADSLHQQVIDQIKHTAERHPIFIHHYRSEKRLRARAIPHHSQDTSKANLAYKSKYLMLQIASNKSAQLRLYRSTLERLRNYQSSYRNLQVNVQWRSSRISSFWVEIYKKFSIPLACLIFVLIGAPIGMYTKNGNIGVSALIGTGFLTFYWLSLIQGEKFADRQVISPFLSMWGSDIILLVIGVILTLTVCTSFKFSNLWSFLRNDK